MSLQYTPVRQLIFATATATAVAIACFASTAPMNSWAQESSGQLEPQTFEGLEFRSIGPAFMSGRIADIAIDSADPDRWFVAVGSGGVWRTDNAGVTWKPVFDDQTSYSIGCVTIDPGNSHRVWVGTGENVGGRHVGFGDGIYLSTDDGNHWTNMGLKNSQHISKIVVHPKDSETVWVAAQGPLWNAGGDRGIFKTTDGGKTWRRVLGDDQWVGATDLVIDPRDPDVLYAATWQRHRTVAAYLGGGPGSGIHRSTDGGETWQRLTEGLPESNMGKIGLAISPQQPDVIYAAIELDRRKGAIYRSADQGSSWSKRSDTVSGGTGPHYYQELYASPHQFDRIYLCDVRIQVSNDGGLTFQRLKEEHKHSDNHAMAFQADKPDYLLVGSDGGLYESFDLANNWRFIANLPVTQFYKIALDDSVPFYNIYGGTQDNATQGGPSRTDNVHGIQNSDWRIILDWDGHQPATEPGNPNIVYAERQEGFLSRIDVSTGEVVDIQPQPEVGEPYERFNWDSPILVSPHSPTRLYFASQRIWRSDNRGDEWKAISGDLTRNEERFALPIMGQTQSWDNAWDVLAMSNYNTITSLAESPLVEGLLYAGTDDGLIQVSEDGGQNWRAIDVSTLPGVPPRSFVNDIRADLHDSDTVYVALDNHKQGDFRPYLLKSTDRGRTWATLSTDLPQRLLVWRLVQDHVRPELMFIATEFGVYFTIDAGNHWTRLQGGLPTISFRDIKIHRRENDLVAASFGRGIFILDDITPLREVSGEQLTRPATLYRPRDAWWYFPRPQLSFEPGPGDQGAAHFLAPNPPFGAVFTYYLKDDLTTARQRRIKIEKERTEAGQPVQFPGWEAVEQERRETDPVVWLVVQDADGTVVRRIQSSAKAGFHRVAWDLRYPPPHAVPLVDPEPEPFAAEPVGMMVAPGEYTVTLVTQVDGKLTRLSDPQSFSVKPLRSGALPGASPQEVAKFWREYDAAVRRHTALQMRLADALRKHQRLADVLVRTPADVGELDDQFHALRQTLLDLDERLNGNRARQEPGEKFNPTVNDRLFAVGRGVDHSTYGPTPTHRRMLEIASQEMEELDAAVDRAIDEQTALIEKLLDAGAPWLQGERPVGGIDR